MKNQSTVVSQSTSYFLFKNMMYCRTGDFVQWRITIFIGFCLILSEFFRDLKENLKWNLKVHRYIVNFSEIFWLINICTCVNKKKNIEIPTIRCEVFYEITSEACLQSCQTSVSFQLLIIFAKKLSHRCLTVF